jgi:hypothetical protein
MACLLGGGSVVVVGAFTITHVSKGQASFVHTSVIMSRAPESNLSVAQKGHQVALEIGGKWKNFIHLMGHLIPSPGTQHSKILI